MTPTEAQAALRTLRAAVEAGRIGIGEARHTENRLIDLAVGARMILGEGDYALIARAIA